MKASNNQSLLDLSYEYNRGSSKGNINGKTGQLTHVVDNLNRNKDRVFEFDTLGRLIVAKGGGATGVSGVTANWTQNYGFDRYGNRTNVSASGITQNSQNVPTDGSPTQSYDNATNRINTAGYIYDLAGNLVKGQSPDGTWQRYDYDSAGRLVTVKKDADGWIQQNNGYGSSRQRVISWSYASTALTWYVWGGSSVLAEYTATSWGSTYDWAKSYIYAGSRLLSTFTKNGASETLEFHHPDRLGTRLVTNDTANTSFEQNTLPFGTALDAESTGASNQRFTSYDRSTVASLDYAVNRSYSSGQGRFTSVDPIGMSATSLGSPQSLNLYAYTKNSPIDYIDPSGLDDITPDEPTEPIAIVDVTAEPEDAFMSDDWQRFLRDSLELREAIQDENAWVVEVTDDEPRRISLIDELYIGYKLQSFLTNECADFIDKLITKATGQPYDSRTQLMQDFGKLLDQKGIAIGGVSNPLAGAVAVSSLRGKSAQIRLINNSKTVLNAVLILHELIHLIVGGSAGQDQALSKSLADLGITVYEAKAVKKNADPNDRDFNIVKSVLPFPKDKDNSNLAYSRYYDYGLQNHCGPNATWFAQH